MEKWSQMKRKLFKFLPKQSVPTSIAFTPPNNPNLSPSRSVPATTTNGSSRGSRSSSHKVSIIPKDVRRKYTTASFSVREPSSPKVSCMGQVQSKKKKKTAQKQKATIAESIYVPFSDQGPNPRGKDFVLEEKPPSIQISPSLGTMKKFTSGRGSLSDFDVTLAER